MSNNIHVEDAKLLAISHHEGDQFIMRLHAPVIAAQAKAGQFVHIQVSPERAMRRPISIMFCDPEKGRLDILIKKIGQGTALLAKRQQGESLSLLGPIGKPFDLLDTSKRYILIGGGVGIPPMLAVAQHLKASARMVCFAGSEVPFPFKIRPSTVILPGIPSTAMMGLDVLENWKVPSRLASQQEYFGCFNGFVTELADQYLSALGTTEDCVLLACGPEVMLHAVAKLGQKWQLPTQLSLEAHMACGIGGCAGCVVKTVENGKEYYRRVCVDGPVFDAQVLAAYAG
ncbi:MAG: dihydroorotate dehydrogenase electron transfer subunit [Mariprofundaceae bacterium]|nr:dihydroorotate dehydrogenase electron transfer subunit [Mariprofundaceae bacterium]